MYMKKETVLALPCIVTACFLMLICAFLIGSETANPFISGFAVDSHDRILIGLHNRIEIFDNGILVDVVRTKTSRGYVFTLLEDDSILLATSTKVYTIDSSGNILASTEERANSIYNQIQRGKDKFTSVNGDLYSIKGKLGRTRIEKNDSIVVYQISPVSFIAKIVLCLAMVLVIILVLIICRIRIKHTGRMFR